MTKNNNQNQYKDKKIKELEQTIHSLNQILDYLTDNYSNVLPDQLTKSMIQLENTYLNIHSTLDWLSFKVTKPRRKIRVIRIDDGDHLVIKCLKKKQNKVIKEEVSFGLSEESD